jgi:hypothetical protein
MPLGEMQRGGGGGSGAKFPDHLGHTLMFVNNEERRDVKTKYGTNDSVAFSEYLVCVTDDVVYRDHLTFAVVMVGDILANPRVAYGTLGRGEERGGQSAPWLLFDLDADEQEKAAAWWDAHAAELPSGRVVIEPTQGTTIPPDDNQPF